MAKFHLKLKTRISNYLKGNAYTFRVVAVWGAWGVGKTTVISSVLNEMSIPSKIISFSEDSLYPFRDIVHEKSYSGMENAITIAVNELLQSGMALVLSNMESCGKDYSYILSHVINFRKTHALYGTIILEYNTDRPPTDAIFSLADEVINFTDISSHEISSYLTENFFPALGNESLFQQIIGLTKGNLANLSVILNCLKQIQFLKEQDGKYLYLTPSERLPGTLLSLFTRVFHELDDAAQTPLRAAAPFSQQIYTNVLQVILHSISGYEIYLKELCEHETLIKKNDSSTEQNSTLFYAPYMFTSGLAQRAVNDATSRNELEGFVKKYYDHLDKIYHNTGKYQSLSDSDRLNLAIILVKNRKDKLTINQIPLIVDIMTFCYKRFLYYEAIHYGWMLIEGRVLNSQQLNQEYHDFYLIYFKSLLAVGEYQRVIEYDMVFEDQDLNYYIAVAYYNSGNPHYALKVLENKKRPPMICRGYTEALLASIFDWLGERKTSLRYFKRALRFCDDAPELKFQLYKRYSLYIDFSIPQCQEKISQAISYYQKTNLKLYAECLHNYGTGSIFISEFSKAKEYLQRSEYVLEKICSKELYYPVNSSAILLCFEANNFASAAKQWQSILHTGVSIDFCRLAVENNLLNAYIHLDNHEMVEQQIALLRDEFSTLCGTEDYITAVRKDRTDIQHQLRQFYFNLGIANKRIGKIATALEQFRAAERCSNYYSNIEYALRKNIEDCENALRSKHLGRVTKHPAPTKYQRYIYENDMYLCELMFWG